MITNFMDKIGYSISNLHSRDILDILLLTSLIFLINLIIIRTRSFKLLIGIFILAIIFLISDRLNLILTKTLLQFILPLSFIIIALVFQKEIRMLLEQFGAAIPKRIIFKNKPERIINDVLKAINYLSQQKIGAIIVFEKVNNLDSLIEGGKLLNSEITPELLISIFDKNSPLHDGAIIIKNDKIKFASAHLPLADNYEFNTKTGTRHRAGLGISQISDATAIIISEENGFVSIAKNGKINYNVSEKEILEKLKDYYQVNSRNNDLLIANLKLFSKYILIFVISGLFAFSSWLLTNYNKFKVQKIIEVPIEFKNLKEDLVLVDPSADKIKVSLSGYDYDLKALNQSQIKAIIDLKDAEEGKYNIEISENNLTNIRPNIEVIQIDPKVIKFKIIKKETNQPGKNKI